MGDLENRDYVFLIISLKKRANYDLFTRSGTMCVVKKGPNHGPAPIPEEGKWVKSKEIVDISGLTHGIGWCAPQQGACKLTLNVKEGVIQEALVGLSDVPV